MDVIPSLVGIKYLYMEQKPVKINDDSTKMKKNFCLN